MRFPLLCAFLSLSVLICDVTGLRTVTEGGSGGVHSLAFFSFLFADGGWFSHIHGTWHLYLVFTICKGVCDTLRDCSED